MLWWEVGVWFLSTTIFLLFQSKSIFGGDAGDLVSTICVGGVAHPPGYPLYTITGRVLNRLPFFTPAWRISLLSSLPAGLIVFLVYWIVKDLTKSKLAGIIASFSLAFSYLFWLYAEVPEVFSLNNLFLVFLTALTISLIKKINEKRLALFFFLSGLSLSHHHYSLWFYPVFGFFIFWFQKKYWQKSPIKKLLSKIPYFLLGLLPYFYVPLAARTHSVINWSTATSLKNFIRLITRADYGTFLSYGGALQVSLKDRLFLAWGKILLFEEYFSWLGIVFLILGLVYLFQKERKFFWLFLSLFFWGVIFIFYAGFRLDPRSVFSIGIYERFLLPGMIFGAIIIGAGVKFLAEEVSLFLIKVFKFQFFNQKRLTLVILLVLLIFPVSLFVKNFYKFLWLKNDLTAENFALDILATVPKNGIVLLSYDNPLFNTQYVHYCLKERPDVSVFHLSLFERDFFYPILKENYSFLSWPPSGSNEFLNEFLKMNYSSHEIYTNNLRYFQKGAFLPVGVLYRYYPSEKEIPTIDEVYKLNQKVWSGYHDPLSGILSQFRPSTLADILENYHTPAKDFALLLFETKKVKESKWFFEKAISLQEKDLESRVYLGRILISENQCQEAEAELTKAAKLAPQTSLPYFYLVVNARDCLKDKQKEAEFQAIYLKNKKLEEGKITDL